MVFLKITYSNGIFGRLVALSAITALLIIGIMPAVFAASANGTTQGTSPGTTTCGTIIKVNSFPTTFTDVADFACKMSATTASGRPVDHHSWSGNIYSITETHKTSITITITDLGFIGDRYLLWSTTNITLTAGWTQRLATSKVFTDSNLVAPSFHKLWDGTGTTHSAGTLIIVIPAGTTITFRVEDALFGQMRNRLDGPCGETPTQLLSNGCSVTGVFVAKGWSPASFTVEFAITTG